jgi:hypothetical protein
VDRNFGHGGLPPPTDCLAPARIVEWFPGRLGWYDVPASAVQSAPRVNPRVRPQQGLYFLAEQTLSLADPVVFEGRSVHPVGVGQWQLQFKAIAGLSALRNRERS